MTKKLEDSVWQHCPAELKSDVEDYTDTYQDITNETRRNLLRNYYQTKLKRAILLVGPPGTGKSTLAKVIASKINRPFVFIKCSTLGDIYQNSGAQNLLHQFEPFLNSGENVVLILDEISAIMEKSDSKQKTEKINTAMEFWSLLDQCNQRKNILVIMTTNTIDDFPEALKSRLSNSTYHIQTLLNVDYKKDILNIHAITPINWDCSWYQFWSRYNNWSLLRSLQTLSPRDVQKIAELASKLAKKRFRNNPGETVQIIPSDITQALTRWNSNIINQPNPSEAFINWREVFKEGLKQTPSILLGVTQAAGSLYLQHDMNERSLKQAENFSNMQYDLSKLISHQQLDKSDEHAQKQLNQNKEHHDEALGKNRTNWQKAGDYAWEAGKYVCWVGGPWVAKALIEHFTKIPISKE